MVKEDSSSEMEPHDEFVEMVTPAGEPNFHLLSPTPVSDSNCCNIQSVCVLPLSTIDHSGVDRQTEERSKEYLRRRKLEEIKKGKYIALDPKDQGRSVNVKRRKFIEVAPHKSKLKLKVRNISATLFEKSAMNLNDLVGDVVVNDESNGAEVASQLVDDDFTTPPPVSSKASRKPKSVPPMNNMNLIDEIRRIFDGQKELREDFQVLKQKVHSLKKLMMESDSKNFNAIEVLSQKFDRNNDSKYEEFRGRDVNVDCDEEYYENNINCDQHVTLHLDNIQTINEDSNNDVKIGDNMSGGASSKSIVIGVHPFGSFNMDVDCLKEMGEFREWMNEGHRPRNKKYPYIKKDNTLNPPFEFGKTIISKKDWFYKFAFSGQSLESSHLDVILYYLRKKGMHDDVPVKFTTTDYLFDLKIKALYKKFIENNGDSDVVKPEHDIANSVDAYRFIIPLFLLILNFFEKRTDIQLNDGPYKNKALVDPFNVVMIEDLPLQQAADRGIYVALFAARFICGRNVFDNEFDVNTQRIKFGSLLWNYGKMKLEKHITNESKSSGIIKKMDCMKRYYN
ncbi:hypothetical protein MTR67_030678 [Solanum verrucosum]|uniref:Ulp1 protease family, C-terminal catalytic domain containing protein n=1 Tax=Solanum verrucosum TaxID=315347 RepID=A0AAF0RAW1_SOLVR|nr:hypothetical protein MTR67_030678 [Solanum verrucosum]